MSPSFLTLCGCSGCSGTLLKRWLITFAESAFVAVGDEIFLVLRFVEAGLGSVLDAAPVDLGQARDHARVIDESVHVAAVEASYLITETQVFELVAVKYDIIGPLHVRDAVEGETDPVIDFPYNIQYDRGNKREPYNRYANEVTQTAFGVFERFHGIVR